MTVQRADFPPNFIFGTATSSYQIEGATREDGRQDSIWDTFCREPGRIRDGSSGDVACDHYHLWPDDLNLLSELGVNAYRFSVAWPRIQPTGSGPVNAAGLDFYDRLVDGLLTRGIRPYLTLYHWDLPQPLQDLGGWTSREVAHRFAEYAAHVAGRLGDRVASVATLNEPWCSSFLSYEIGEHAPGHRGDRRGALAAAHHLLLGHGQAMQAMRAQGVKAELGIVLNLTPAYPATDSPADRDAARRADGTANRWFLDPIYRAAYPEDLLADFAGDLPDIRDGDLDVIAAPLDFLGVNYYSRTYASADGQARPQGAGYTHMDWEVYPQGLTDLLVRLDREYGARNLLITENGAAYPDERGTGSVVHDPERVAYYQSHLGACAEAIRQGVDLRGYFAWSMLDNFEWSWGYSRRFGLFYVDYQTQERLWKDSGLWYRDLVRAPVAAD